MLSHDNEVIALWRKFIVPGAVLEGGACDNSRMSTTIERPQGEYGNYMRVPVSGWFIGGKQCSTTL